jgi:hypothetical protein
MSKPHGMPATERFLPMASIGAAGSGTGLDGSGLLRPKRLRTRSWR